MCRFVAEPVEGATELTLSSGETTLTGAFACDTATLDRMVDGRAAGRISLHSYSVGAATHSWIDARETLYGPRGAMTVRSELLIVSNLSVADLLAGLAGSRDGRLPSLEIWLSPRTRDAEGEERSLSPHDPIIRESRPPAAPSPSRSPVARTNNAAPTEVAKEVRALVQRHWPELRRCAPGGGALVVELAADGQGTLRYLDVTASSVDEATGRCLLDAIRALPFPPSPGAVVALPLVFKK